LLAQQGAKVVAPDVLEQQGARPADEIGPAAALGRRGVTDEGSWSEAVADTLGRFGRRTVLGNSAGLLHIQALVDTPAEVVERLWRVNALGPFLGMRAVARVMQAAGGGWIVNVASVDGLSAKNGLAAYAPSKWALRGLTRVAALELGQLGIRVNTVCPEAGGPGMRRAFTPEGIDPLQTLAFT